jgi:CO/xanthine dehydrogenase FAD-binding subunit
MKGDAAAHEVRTARALPELLELMAAEPGAWRPLAGGTDLMVSFAAGKLEDRRLVDMWRLAELRGIAVEPEAVTVGALTSYTEIREHPLLAREFPMLCRAAAETGGWAIQNRGTLGGNIANGSPAADSPPALMAYGAEVELRRAEGARWVDYGRFHTGYKQTVMRPDEIISRIRLPRAAGERIHFYRKVGPRRAQAISKVCFAACAEPGGGPVRIAVGAVAPAVLRCFAAEACIAADPRDPERARAALAAEIAPIDDLRSTAAYRRRVAENLLAELVRVLAGGAAARAW